MTDHRPDHCQYNRRLGYNTIREHEPDCEDPRSHRGCTPCPEPHCAVCGRIHTTHDQPLTCPTCLGKIRTDLEDLATAYALLPEEASNGGNDGRPLAAAPIPGGNAQILMGPSVRWPNRLRWTRTLAEDHRRNDPIPPLAVIAQWEDLYRAWLNHPTHRAASVDRAVAYLLMQLPYIAQRTDGPDFVEMTRQVRRLRDRVERALHDEREPERGVECFECGEQLVRRFHRPAPCRHQTPARTVLERWLRLGYPEALTVIDVRAARQPCGRDDCDQGGIDDPSAGLSWECPGCRKDYDPGEYATAVRRDLLQRGPQGDGWTHISMAAEAASTLVGRVVLPGTIRKWVERGKVESELHWKTGARLVFWPDVAEEAVAAVARAKRAAELRRLRAAREGSGVAS